MNMKTILCKAVPRLILHQKVPVRLLKTRLMSTKSNEGDQSIRRTFSTTTTQSSAVVEQTYVYSPPSLLKPLPMIDFFATSKPAPSYKFNYGATGYPKRNRAALPVQDNHYMSHQVGEDAFFLRHDSIGVADGVGGWSSTAGSHAALYSRKLMHHAFLEMERFDNIDDPNFSLYHQVNPMDVLQATYQQSMNEAQDENCIGSSTACLAILRNDEIRIANLGDCRISIIRNNSYVFRSEEQQHSFNYPYQLGTRSRDRPHHAQPFNVKTEKGDIIIMGTDGLFDNLFDRDILDIVKKHVAGYTIPGNQHRAARVLDFDPKGLSDSIAKQALEISEDKRHTDTPFQRHAMQEGFYFQGGKADDISVVVAVVQDCEDSPDRRF
ncbi:phosphatase 2C-like domain-containing protein [Spinellus fusiger]|nr:phosphatase 2C-like domain-containing protein [Spinellus fusiger]